MKQINKFSESTPEVDRLILIFNDNEHPYTALLSDAEQEIDYINGDIEYIDTLGVFTSYGCNSLVFLKFLDELRDEAGWLYFDDVIDGVVKY